MDERLLWFGAVFALNAFTLSVLAPYGTNSHHYEGLEELEERYEQLCGQKPRRPRFYGSKFMLVMNTDKLDEYKGLLEREIDRAQLNRTYRQFVF